MPEFGGVSENLFLSRLGQGSRPKASECHPGSLPRGLKPEDAYTLEEKLTTFASRLEALGGEVLRVTDEAAAWATLRKVCKARGINRALLGGGLDGLAKELADAGITAWQWPDLDLSLSGVEHARARIDGAEIGVAWVDYAVAELGAVAVQAHPQTGRCVSLVPPLFVALVRRGCVRYFRRTVLKEIRQSSRYEVPLAFTFIAGPSRSADIEMDLSIGVHGPGQVMAIVI